MNKLDEIDLLIKKSKPEYSSKPDFIKNLMDKLSLQHSQSILRKKIVVRSLVGAMTLLFIFAFAVNQRHQTIYDQGQPNDKDKVSSEYSKTQDEIQLTKIASDIDIKIALIDKEINNSNSYLDFSDVNLDDLTK